MGGTHGEPPRLSNAMSQPHMQPILSLSPRLKRRDGSCTPRVETPDSLPRGGHSFVEYANKMETDEVPEEFPRDTMPAVVPGVQPKICVVLHNGVYIAGQTPEERHERWLICEDLVEQLVPVAEKEAAAHPEQSQNQTLERVQVSVARKGWVSPDELTWMVHRLRTLLGW